MYISNGFAISSQTHVVYISLYTRLNPDKMEEEVKYCEHCWFPLAKIYLCTCRAVRYCDEYCQHSDWKRHRKKCAYRVQQRLLSKVTSVDTAQIIGTYYRVQ